MPQLCMWVLLYMFQGSLLYNRNVLCKLELFSLSMSRRFQPTADVCMNVWTDRGGYQRPADIRTMLMTQAHVHGFSHILEEYYVFVFWLKLWVERKMTASIVSANAKQQYMFTFTRQRPLDFSRGLCDLNHIIILVLCILEVTYKWCVLSFYLQDSCSVCVTSVFWCDWVVILTRSCAILDAKRVNWMLRVNTSVDNKSATTAQWSSTFFSPCNCCGSNSQKYFTLRLTNEKSISIAECTICFFLKCNNAIVQWEHNRNSSYLPHMVDQ